MRAALYLVLFFAFSQAVGQTKEAEQEPNCYQKYQKVFEERGANDVEDGWHDNVIITVRRGNYADCFLGKVKVVKGMVIPADMYIKFEDASYELVKKKYKHEFPIEIVNGISKTMVTNEDELINILFTAKVKPKKKEYQRAPEPSFD